MRDARASHFSTACPRDCAPRLLDRFSSRVLARAGLAAHSPRRRSRRISKPPPSRSRGRRRGARRARSGTSSLAAGGSVLEDALTTAPQRRGWRVPRAMGRSTRRRAARAAGGARAAARAVVRGRVRRRERVSAAAGAGGGATLRPSAALRLLDEAEHRAARRGTLARLLHLRGLVHLRDGRQARRSNRCRPLRELLRRGELTDPAELTAAARGLALLARLEGTPAQDHHAAMSLLAKARELDPLHWPAMVAEAELLAAKGNREEAAQALMQALSLNPRSAGAWFGLGRGCRR